MWIAVMYPSRANDLVQPVSFDDRRARWKVSMECPAAVNLWRGSLLPLGRAAALCLGAAAQPSGSKLPRHKVLY
ncbi:hypothetical protein PBDP_5248 [Pseudomonas sp. St290]|nr:hypothetical protein PBDP_5248 [Pseudomonas sp. St290]